MRLSTIAIKKPPCDESQIGFHGGDRVWNSFSRTIEPPTLTGGLLHLEHNGNQRSGTNGGTRNHEIPRSPRQSGDRHDHLGGWRYRCFWRNNLYRSGFPAINDNRRFGSKVCRISNRRNVQRWDFCVFLDRSAACLFCCYKCLHPCQHIPIKTRRETGSNPGDARIF